MVVIEATVKEPLGLSVIEIGMRLPHTAQRRFTPMTVQKPIIILVGY